MHRRAPGKNEHRAAAAVYRGDRVAAFCGSRARFEAVCDILFNHARGFAIRVAKQLNKEPGILKVVIMTVNNDSLPVIPTYLDLLDDQRETALAALSGLTNEQIWQRPEAKEWCVGEILSHNYKVMASFMPYVRFAWRFFHWYGVRYRSRPYRKEIPDLYRNPNFPMWIGVLWSPRYKPNKPVPFDQLKSDLRELHQGVRHFYEGKEEDILGNISIFDPYFGWFNLIDSLRLGIYHDQLHYEDVFKYASAWAGT